MKIKITISIFILSLGSYTKAQNLVLNPSFEQHTQCPNTESQINYCNSWVNGDLHGTCDYYSANNCAGNFSPPYISRLGVTWVQQPLSGLSYAGFIPYYNMSNMASYIEYPQGEFVSPLVINQLYYMEFYINSASQMQYYIHDISALITDTSGFVNTSNVQSYTPQILPLSGKVYTDTVKWMRINGYYTAHGGEKYIIIGNFALFGSETKDSIINFNSQLGSAAYYFIDSVGVYPVTQWDSWNAGVDKYITLGDSAQIGNPSSDYSIFSWVTSTNGITYLSDSTMPQIWSKPPATTTYYVTKTQGTNILQDTVTVYVTNGAGIKQLMPDNAKINLYPNPNNGTMMLDYSINDDASLEITDITGNLVGTYNLPATETTMKVQSNNLQNGMYLYRVISNNVVIKLGKIVVMQQ